MDPKRNEREAAVDAPDRLVDHGVAPPSPPAPAELPREQSFELAPTLRAPPLTVPSTSAHAIWLGAVMLLCALVRTLPDQEKCVSWLWSINLEDSIRAVQTEAELQAFLKARGDAISGRLEVRAAVRRLELRTKSIHRASACPELDDLVQFLSELERKFPSEPELRDSVGDLLRELTFRIDGNLNQHRKIAASASKILGVLAGESAARPAHAQLATYQRRVVLKLAGDPLPGKSSRDVLKTFDLHEVGSNALLSRLWGERERPVPFTEVAIGDDSIDKSLALNLQPWPDVTIRSALFGSLGPDTQLDDPALLSLIQLRQALRGADTAAVMRAVCGFVRDWGSASQVQDVLLGELARWLLAQSEASLLIVEPPPEVQAGRECLLGVRERLMALAPPDASKRLGKQLDLLQPERARDQLPGDVRAALDRWWNRTPSDLPAKAEIEEVGEPLHKRVKALREGEDRVAEALQFEVGLIRQAWLPLSQAAACIVSRRRAGSIHEIESAAEGLIRVMEEELTTHRPTDRVPVVPRFIGESHLMWTVKQGVWSGLQVSTTARKDWTEWSQHTGTDQVLSVNVKREAFDSREFVRLQDVLLGLHLARVASAPQGGGVGSPFAVRPKETVGRTLARKILEGIAPPIEADEHVVWLKRRFRVLSSPTYPWSSFQFARGTEPVRMLEYSPAFWPEWTRRLSVTEAGCTTATLQSLVVHARRIESTFRFSDLKIEAAPSTQRLHQLPAWERVLRRTVDLKAWRPEDLDSRAKMADILDALPEPFREAGEDAMLKSAGVTAQAGLAELPLYPDAPHSPRERARLLVAWRACLGALCQKFRPDRAHDGEKRIAHHFNLSGGWKPLWAEKPYRKLWKEREAVAQPLLDLVTVSEEMDP